MLGCLVVAHAEAVHFAEEAGLVLLETRSQTGYVLLIFLNSLMLVVTLHRLILLLLLECVLCHCDVLLQLFERLFPFQCLLCQLLDMFVLVGADFIHVVVISSIFVRLSCICVMISYVLGCAKRIKSLGY